MAGDPKRIQYRRGQMLPAGAKLCSRPSKWGNPFKIGSLYAHPDSDRVPPLPEEPGWAVGTGIVRDIAGRSWLFTIRRVTSRAHAVALFIAWAPKVRDEKTGLSLPELARRELAGKTLACYCPLDLDPCHCDPLMAWAAGRRPSTPEYKVGPTTTVKVKRACNGCGLDVGDVTDEEIAAAMNGEPLPDVRGECPDCSKEMSDGD